MESRRIKKIGEGNTGCVFAPCNNTSRYGQQCIMKVMKKELAEQDFETENRITHIFDPEGKYSVSFQDIIYDIDPDLFSYFKTKCPKVLKNVSDIDDYALLIRTNVGRSLADFVKDKGRNLDLKMMIKSIKNNIVKGLQKLHRSGYIHNDLHPGNILVNDNYRSYLVDFEKATRKTSNNLSHDFKYTTPKRNQKAGILNILKFVAQKAPRNRQTEELIQGLNQIVESNSHDLNEIQSMLHELIEQQGGNNHLSDCIPTSKYNSDGDLIPADYLYKSYRSDGRISCYDVRDLIKYMKNKSPEQILDWWDREPIWSQEEFAHFLNFVRTNHPELLPKPRSKFIQLEIIFGDYYDLRTEFNPMLDY